MTDSILVPTIKIAGAVYNSRQLLLSALCHGIRDVLSTKIVVTGMAGSGKSFLFNYLKHTTKKSTMIWADQSVNGEYHTIYLGNGKLPKKAVIIPGQKIAIAKILTDKHLINNNKLQGIIHLMDYGYNAPRDKYSESILHSQNIYNFDELILANRDEELNYLESLIDHIYKMKTKPNWFCLILSKVDLYNHSVAIKYYNENEKFINCLNKIYSIFPEDKVKLFIPVCSDISTITFGKEDRHPTFIKNHKEAKTLIFEFCAYIEMIDV